MATPPFSINEAVPGDSDFASQFPALERTFRDIVESGLLTNHNNQGRHDKVELDWQDPDPTGVAEVETIFADDAGNLKRLPGEGTVQYLQVPPGTVLEYYGATLPEGYLWANGAAVSRTTYATLFDVVSITFGAGDGSTTFNLPDKRDRTAVGKANMGGAADPNLINGYTTTALGTWIGEGEHVLTTGELAAHKHNVAAANESSHTHLIARNETIGEPANTRLDSPTEVLANRATPSSGIAYDLQAATNTTHDSGKTSAGSAHTHTISEDTIGSSTAHNNVQPAIVANFIIKY